ncbi:MaoC family dehydratase [Pseudohoeflea coraliihabitans]|uniref:MaoC family dehydratase n=1 Tax=Pseudohoeflea coraliihabitans TaxID=2860393 RepID=A0ABS6WSY2_9HYPH|nr:MaoC family dehydratase [Pseudohoeflea sp. DP4N28-3]MBW3098175.1 MaoC family dehydratase [Pseudohoeflea sp. DP4N28-3]
MAHALNSPLPQSIIARQIVTSAAMAQAYAELTTDFNPIHLDPDFAAGTAFGGPIVHGTLSLNLLVTAIEETFGNNAELAVDVRFVRPVPVGSCIRAGGHLRDADTRTYEIFVEMEAGERAVEGTCTLGALSPPPAAPENPPPPAPPENGVSAP